MSPEIARDLLRRIVEEQDTEAFSALYEAYAPRIKSYMLRQTSDAETAEEVAQEALVTVWRKANLYSPDKGAPSSWIFAIARNLRIDRIRKERVLQPLPDDYDDLHSDDMQADELMILQQRQDALRVALADLPPDQLEVVRLSYIEGLSHSQIAEKLRIPIGTVKSRMRLAYERMQPLLEHVG